MASCSNCRHTVSPQARFCPSCGHPDPGKNEAAGAAGLAVIALLALATAFLSPALAANYLLGRFPGDLWSKTFEDPASWIGSTVVWMAVALRWWQKRGGWPFRGADGSRASAPQVSDIFPYAFALVAGVLVWRWLS